MADYGDPVLEGIEADLADISTTLHALRDLTRYWHRLDSDAALKLVETAATATIRIKRRAIDKRRSYKRSAQPLERPGANERK